MLLSLVTLLAAANVAAGATSVDPDLPFPASQGANNMNSFVKNCRIYASGNASGLAAPVTYFSKMPHEWLSSTNTTVAACSKKFETNFATLNGADIKAFYVEMCPLLGPAYGNHMSMLPFPASQGGNKFQVFIFNCYDLAAGKSGNLSAPNSYFSSIPGEWLVSDIPIVKACAKKFEANFSSLAGDQIKAFYVEMCPLLAPRETTPPTTTSSVSASATSTSCTSSATATVMPTVTSTTSCTSSATASALPTLTVTASPTATVSPTSTMPPILSGAQSNVFIGSFMSLMMSVMATLVF